MANFSSPFTNTNTGTLRTTPNTVLNSSSSKANQYQSPTKIQAPSKLTELRTIYNGNKTYWAPDGNYYYSDGTKMVKITDKNIVKEVAKNLPRSIGAPATPTKSTKSTTTKSSSSGGGGGYSGGGGGGSVNNSYYEKLLNEYKKKIDELEHPKVYTAAELAKLYDVEDQYNYDKILQMYNDATNKYYNDAIANQVLTNLDAERSNASYGEALLKQYLSGYQNAAPTAVGRGTIAANALSTMLGADKANEEASSNLNSIINSYKEAWQNEIANNATTARQQYNSVGEWLLNKGANLNTADVQNYINTLNAYDTAYSAIRNAQNNLASTAAAAYQNNANAALARNQYNNANAMAKYYKAYYGTEGNAWQKAYQNVLDDQATYNMQKSSAN